MQQRRKDAAAKAEDLVEQQRLRLLEKERIAEANRIQVRIQCFHLVLFKAQVRRATKFQAGGLQLSCHCHMREVAGLHAQVDRKRAEEEAQRRAEDAEREAEREEARRRAEADAELKMRYYEVTHPAPALSCMQLCTLIAHCKGALF